MALTHTVAMRNAISDAVLAAIGNSGQLVLYTVGDTEIATLTLPATSGTVGATDLTFGTFTDDTNATGGTCTYMAIETSGGLEIFQFPEGDVTLSNTVIGAGDTVQCSSLVYTPPA
jgi:hypothetical protein